MAANYAELKAEILEWMDDPDPKAVSNVGLFIADAEALFNRDERFRFRDMECHTVTPLVPDGVTDDQRGIYPLPLRWGGALLAQEAGDNLSVLYWQRIQALSDANPTNWLLDKYPDLYRIASLISGEQFVKNDERSAYWRMQTEERIVSISGSDELETSSGEPLVSRVPSQRPWRCGDTDKRYDYLPSYDFFELKASNVPPTSRLRYFTVSEGSLLIWPVPQTDPTGPGVWSGCGV